MIEPLNEFLERTYFNNTVLDYLIALGIILLGFLLTAIFKRILLRRIKGWTQGTETDADNFLIERIERFGIPALYLFAAYTGINYLNLSEKTQKVLGIIVTVVITIMVIQLIFTTVIVLLRAYLKRQENAEEKMKQLAGLRIIIGIVIWSLGTLFLFDNLGYDISAVIAGLGIGGIAVALAAQNILGDLFNYFVIFFDRPFEIGDFLVIDDKNGIVESIGIKTTRIKTLSGEQLVFANSDLTASRIHNYKHMQRRRVLFRIGVTYQTTYQQLKDIPEIIKDIVLQQELIEFDRAHFAAYGNFSLDFEVVYYILTADYTKYMDIHQSINLGLYEAFEQRGIAFAYPTQTLFIHQEQEERQPQTALQS